jgi:hypothetical protein
MTPETALPDAPPARLERELKFLLPEGRAAAALALLRALCRPDRRHASNVVSTIYYDTPGLQLLDEKIHSDYLKAKVRLRWYRTEGDGPPTGPSFLEIKRRVGALRTKTRTATPLDPAWLERAQLEDPALIEVLELAAPLGVPLPKPLVPALLLRYRRHRFVEPVSGARLSLDTDLVVVRGRTGLFRGAAPTAIATAVLELKGDTGDLPRTLQPLARLGPRRAAFSKYGAAARGVLAPLR